MVATITYPIEVINSTKDVLYTIMEYKLARLAIIKQIINANNSIFLRLMVIIVSFILILSDLGN